METTNPYGFDPGSRREFTDSFGRVTGYSYVPPGQYGRRRELGDKGLLALILYNRNAYDTEAGRYLEALQPAVDAHALRGDPESARAAAAVQPERGLLLRPGRPLRGGGGLPGGGGADGCADPRLARVREDLLHNWAVSLIEAGRLEEAQALIDARRAARGAVRKGVAQPGGLDLAAARQGGFPARFRRGRGAIIEGPGEPGAGSGPGLRLRGVRAQPDGRPGQLRAAGRGPGACCARACGCCPAAPCCGRTKSRLVRRPALKRSIKIPPFRQ